MIDKKNLAELEKQLLAEKENLEKDLSRIARPVNKEGGDYETSFEEIGSDRDDNATEVDQYTDNLSVETALEKKLQGVIESLEKIREGKYGVCENCGQEIDLERLMVNPSAKNCMKCK